jgi:hypothetical protein
MGIKVKSWFILNKPEVELSQKLGKGVFIGSIVPGWRVMDKNMNPILFNTGAVLWM